MFEWTRTQWDGRTGDKREKEINLSFPGIQPSINTAILGDKVVEYYLGFGFRSSQGFGSGVFKVKVQEYLGLGSGVFKV